MTAALLTIDTELSPSAHRRGMAVDENFQRAILGRVSDGEWGIGYQIERLNAYGLKGVFFVEALSAEVVGVDLLKRTVEPILSAGHEVQLHIHTEWLEWFQRDPVDGRRGRSICNFGLDDQYRLLERGIELMTGAGGPQSVAFRAGNYGADNNTLRALAKLGLQYDTSYNLCAPNGACRIVYASELFDPAWIDGVVEIPVVCFADYLDHRRPAQICASSASELALVTRESARLRRQTAVFVSHSFELLNRSRTRANHLLVRRFERFCELLARGNSIVSEGFSALDSSRLVNTATATGPLRSNAGRTLLRMAEQALGSVLY